MAHERHAPLAISIERCMYCRRLFWPWQDVVRDYDPECGGRPVHHECHHTHQQLLWGAEDETWTDWLNCEHATNRA